MEDGVSVQARRPIFIRIPFSPNVIADMGAVLTILRVSVLILSKELTSCGPLGIILAWASRMPRGLLVVFNMSKKRRFVSYLRNLDFEKRE